MRSWLPTFGYSLFILCGFMLMESTWNGTVYVYLGEARGPAATHNLSDFFPVDGRILRLPKEDQIFNSTKFLDHDGELGIQLGHLLLQDPLGNFRFACEVASRPAAFDRIELSFDAVGVSEDGQTPLMMVDSPCRAQEDPLRLEPIWIPMSQIYETDPQSRYLELPEAGSTAIRLQNLASVWPEKWTLVKVRLYHSGITTPSLILSPRQGVSRDSLSFDWKKR